MDGYTSVVAPLLFNGQKVNKPSSCPVIIICDIDVMMTAPKPMFVSGVGDVLGKYIAKADWLLGRIINDEIYCPVCATLLQAVDNCMNNIDIIKNRTPEAQESLLSFDSCWNYHSDSRQYKAWHPSNITWATIGR